MSRAESHPVARAPCKSCPYRQDVPSGIWDAEEHAKLPGYDGEIIDQLCAGATAIFLCHQQDGSLCAGWIACHGAHNLLALRLHGDQVRSEAWDYATSVPVFASGAEAAAHGTSDIDGPGPRAHSAITRLLRRRMAARPQPPQDGGREG